MREYSGKEFSWNGNSLYKGKDFTGFEAVPMQVLGKEMFKIKWPDKMLSSDYYNKARAKDHAMREARRFYNIKDEATEPVETLK